MKGAMLGVYRWLVLGMDESAGSGWGRSIFPTDREILDPRLSRAWLSSIPATRTEERSPFLTISDLMAITTE